MVWIFLHKDSYVSRLGSQCDETEVVGPLRGRAQSEVEFPSCCCDKTFWQKQLRREEDYLVYTFRSPSREVRVGTRAETTDSHRGLGPPASITNQENLTWTHPSCLGNPSIETPQVTLGCVKSAVKAKTSMRWQPNDPAADGININLQSRFDLTASQCLDFPATKTLDMTWCQIFGFQKHRPIQ